MAGGRTLRLSRQPARRQTDLARPQRPELAPFGVRPWRVDTFQFSIDPALKAKIRDVVGLYLHPPEQAVVLGVDEKPQIQARQRTAPAQRVRPDHPEAASFDYVGHGTTTLFAALEVGPPADPVPRVTDASGR
jgi:hypothetical protein